MSSSMIDLRSLRCAPTTGGTIALFKFGHVGWPADQWTLPPYYLAQGLIAFCVLPRSRPADPAVAAP